MFSIVTILLSALALHLIILGVGLLGQNSKPMKPRNTGMFMAVAGFGLITVWALPNAVQEHGLVAGYGALVLVGASIAASIFAKRYWVLSRLCDTRSFFFVVGTYYRNPRLARIASGINSVILVFLTGLIFHLIGMMSSALSGLGTLGFYIGVFTIAILALGLSRPRCRRNVSRGDVIHFWLYAAGVVLLGMIVLGAADGLAGLGAAIERFVATGAGFSSTDGRGGGDFSAFLAIPGVYQDVTNVPGDFAVGSPWTGLMLLSASMGAISLFVSQWAFVQIASSSNTRSFAADHVIRFAFISGGVAVVFGVAFGLGPVAGMGWSIWDIMAGEVSDGLNLPVRFGVCLVGLVVATVTLTATFDAFSANGPERSPDEGLAISRVVFMAGVAALLAFLPLIQLVDYVTLALALSAQMLPMIVGLCWLPWLSRRGVLAGLVVGIVVAVLTEFPGPLLQRAFLGDIFWGESPLTMHAAGWGLLANGFVTIVVSALTQSLDAHQHRQQFHAAFMRHAQIRDEARGLIPIAWVYSASWFLFALGPGAVIGNSIFGAPDQGHAGWNFPIPSIWAWQIFMWIIGVALVWFLATRLGLSQPVEGTVKPWSQSNEDTSA